MTGYYKVIMDASLVMVASLAVVLGVVLVLLAELYCSLLHRRRQLQMSSSNANPTTTTTSANANAAGNVSSQTQQLQGQSASPHQPLGSFFAHGVLSAPRSFLFPAVHDKESMVDIEKKQFRSQLRQFFESEARESNTPHWIGVVSASPSSPSFISASSLKPIETVTLQGGSTGEYNGEGCGSSGGENFVYISNPIYDNEVRRPCRADTPFETPGASPSHLGTGGSSGNGSVGRSSPSDPSSFGNTPPLSPLKKLPAEACSVALRDAGSLDTSGSDSNTKDGLSSSSSGSSCTSPSC